MNPRGIGGDIAAPRRVRQPVPAVRQQPAERRTAVRSAPARPVPRAAAPKARRTGRWLWDIAQYPLVAAVALGAAYSAELGQALVGAYVLIALWRRGRSRLTFGLAVALLATAPLFLALGQTGIAQRAAIYAFELLVFGTGQAIWELKKIEKTPN